MVALTSLFLSCCCFIQESGNTPAGSALVKLTNRLNFLKERRALLASEMQNLDLSRAQQNQTQGRSQAGAGAGAAAVAAAAAALAPPRRDPRSASRSTD
jgi:hypothetical protein